MRGAATTTVYPQTNADESAFILSDSESKVLIAENAEQLAKAVAKRSELPDLHHVVVIDRPASRPATGSSPWPSWRAAAPPTWRSTPS